jgi:integrase
MGSRSVHVASAMLAIARRLQWSDVNLRARTLTIHATKREKTFSVPMTSADRLRVPKLPEFQCRVLGDDPVPRCAAGAADHTIESGAAAGPHQPPTRIQVVATSANRRPGGASGSVCLTSVSWLMFVSERHSSKSFRL